MRYKGSSCLCLHLMSCISTNTSKSENTYMFREDPEGCCLLFLLTAARRHSDADYTACHTNAQGEIVCWHTITVQVHKNNISMMRSSAKLQVHRVTASLLRGQSTKIYHIPFSQREYSPCPLLREKNTSLREPF